MVFSNLDYSAGYCVYATIISIHVLFNITGHIFTTLIRIIKMTKEQKSWPWIFTNVRGESRIGIRVVLERVGVLLSKRLGIASNAQLIRKEN
ncbi:hypothetical protein SODALDRAFT_5183 [Sodiomyces alkalinus F11]|uniref:Uncharacterized protein n=1 Tax=Sodiomyces alkalinus (strain CBS 110278 / VKM F-3762 / F11) TaxID=1314773 RepID=A0A3N2Q5M8_SODAK|nr:hypothetical protein SODALDRAFT_5183 [Sodiomyces alkalinus F11]ROT42006.1 hypothetical protein SODALDRAFT_5183 [Sodiomyces alkalinus F11]